MAEVDADDEMLELVLEIELDLVLGLGMLEVLELLRLKEELVLELVEEIDEDDEVLMVPN